MAIGRVRPAPAAAARNEGMDNFLAYLSGQTQRDWRLEDFKFKCRRMPRPKSDEVEPTRDPGRQNLFDLTVEFLGYLRREENVPYTRGEMGRASLFEYIVNRYAGDLPPGENLFESMERQRLGRRRPKQGRPDHLLCPDRATLDRYLGGLLNFVNPQCYKVVATFELVPAWLRFLESRGLLGGRTPGSRPERDEWTLL